MVLDESIIELGEWLRTPPGLCLLHWEQARLDQAVADVFGYHALQLGLPELQGLRSNRMPHRWVATDSMHPVEPPPLPPPVDCNDNTRPFDPGASLHCDFDALPFPDHSLDLVVLPHALELSRDPHLTLREVERVLVPEGQSVGAAPAPRAGTPGRRAGGQRQALLAARRRAPWLLASA
jgi:SAM-dependent methyltransferase